MPPQRGFLLTDRLDGRRQFVNVLDCYLRRNLVSNGGILDEVRFVVHTREEEDRQWLEDLVKRDGMEKQYILQHEDTQGDNWKMWRTGFSKIWKGLTDPHTIYVKIDDDIVSSPTLQRRLSLT